MLCIFDMSRTVGTMVNIYIEGAEPMRMKVDPDFTARQLARQIVNLPHYLNSKVSAVTHLSTHKLIWY